MTLATRTRLAALCIVLFMALFFDAASLFRMMLCCSIVHELGHVITYRLCAKCWPKLTIRLGGVAMAQDQCLPRKHELLVLCAGPAMNFLFALFWCVLLQVQARYLYYFFAGISLCLGFFNLLPIGTLDGARILQCMLPAKGVLLFVWTQRIITCIFCFCCFMMACFLPLPLQLRYALLIIGAYLLWQNLFYC